MVADPIAQWALTIVFGALAAYSATRIVVDRKHPVPVVGHNLHVLMLAGMAAMSWPWWGVLPALPQWVVFALGSLWFLAQAAFPVGRATSSHPGGHGAGHQVGHAVMMAAMVWMVLAMSSQTGQGEHLHSLTSAPTVLTGIAATAALLVTGVVLLVELIDRLMNRILTWHTSDLAGGAIMSFLMAATCWLMLAT